MKIPAHAVVSLQLAAECRYWRNVSLTFSSHIPVMPGRGRVSCSARTSEKRILLQALSGATTLPVLPHGSWCLKVAPA